MEKFPKQAQGPSCPAYFAVERELGERPAVSRFTGKSIPLLYSLRTESYKYGRNAINLLYS